MYTEEQRAQDMLVGELILECETALKAALYDLEGMMHTTSRGKVEAALASIKAATTPHKSEEEGER